jgi:glycosyltransferase involved in cell wall biosynthesis
MSNNAQKIIISVVVCTYNRSLLLRNCLASLASQDVAIEQYEVIVVDNCSTDDTDAVIQEFIKGHKNFCGFKEDNLGLSHARNRGWKEALGEYVAYIDDDAVPFSDWIAQIKSFSERRSQVLVFGGPYESFSMVPVPAWFPPDYGNLRLEGNERPIAIGEEWISGTNMIIKKELLLELGGFNTSLGMSGSRISYGEETRLLLDLKTQNISVYYVPKIKVRHLIADYKMRLSWLLSSSYEVGKCSALTFGVHRSLRSHISCIGACTLAGIGKLFAFGAGPYKRRIFVSFSPLFIEFGALVEYVYTIKRKLCGN